MKNIPQKKCLLDKYRKSNTISRIDKHSCMPYQGWHKKIQDSVSISNVLTLPNVSTIESMQKSNILHMVCIVFLICMDLQSSRRRSTNDIHFFNTYLLKNCFYFKCHWCRDLLSPGRKVTSGILLALYFLSAWICSRDVANDIHFFNTNLFKNYFYFNCN